jgi:hypothetical protein
MRTKARKFTIMCDKCRSASVDIENTLDADISDGAWGSVRIVCRDCGAEEEVGKAP